MNIRVWLVYELFVCAVVDADGGGDTRRIHQRFADVDERSWRTVDVIEPTQRRHAVDRRTIFR